jgi:DNA-binding NarL/FixJ family response regulator
VTSVPSVTLRLLVVDDHPVVRAGLVAMLGEEPDFDVVGEAADGSEAVARAAELRPDVVLMDLRMPGRDGAEATARLWERGGPPVLVLTTYDTDADIVRAVEAGAMGYLLKDAPRAVLADAVRAAARGETVLAPPVVARLASRLRSASSGPELTPREVEVLGCVARGLSNAEVGRELFIGEATVKTHLLRAFEKLGVTDRTAAVTAAYRLGVIEL